MLLHPEWSDLVHAAVGDGDGQGWLVLGVGGQLCDLPYDGHALEHFAEDDMPSVQPWGGSQCDVKL